MQTQPLETGWGESRRVAIPMNSGDSACCRAEEFPKVSNLMVSKAWAVRGRLDGLVRQRQQQLRQPAEWLAD